MKKTILTMCLMTAMNVSNVCAQVGDEGPTLTPNKLGLVYEDAISENKEGQVNIHRVEYGAT